MKRSLGAIRTIIGRILGTYSTRSSESLQGPKDNLKLKCETNSIIWMEFPIDIEKFSKRQLEFEYIALVGSKDRTISPYNN